MNLGIDKKTIAFAIAIFVVIIISGFLANSAGLSVSQIMDLQGWRTTLSKFFSAEFIGFVLLVPLAFSLAIIAMKKSESMQTLGVCSASAAMAAIITLFAFSNLQYYWVLAVFFVLSIPLSMYYSTIILKELKKFVVFRGANSAIHKAGLLMVIGILVFGAVTLAPKNQQMAMQFEYSMMGMVLGKNLSGITTMGNTGIFEKLADNLISQQLQTAEQLTSSELFQKLRQKNDEDVTAFVASTDALKQQLESQAYRQQVINQLKQNSQSAAQQAGINEEQILQMMKKQFPIMQQFEDWFWLVTALLLVTIMQFVVTIIIAPLGAAYTLALDRIVPEEAQN